MSYIQTTTDSTGKKYHAEFDPRYTAPIRQWTERPDGTIEYEFQDGQGRGTTAPEGLYPQRKATP
jgi:hypothetical protein